MNTSMLQATELSKAYGSATVLNGVDIEVGCGETLAIVGRSGSGKTTLLRCLSANEKLDEGAATLDGQPYIRDGKLLFEPWEIRRNIILVFQDYRLLPNLTVRDNIAFGLRKVKGLERREAEEKAQRCAELLQIDRVLKNYPNEISGGEAQRCALARAIVLEPRVLLLDEITAALDPESVASVVRAIRALRQADSSGKMALVMVTHLMRFAEEFADSVAFMHKGCIWEKKPAAEFFRACSRAETQSFVNASANMFAAGS